MEFNLGLDKIKSEEIAHGLHKVLEETFDLYLKTQNYHWNITGNAFASLHKLFEDQYIDLANANDELAERIRTLGFTVSGSYYNPNNAPAIGNKEPFLAVNDMISNLLKDHEQLVRTARDLCSEVSQALDYGTANLLSSRIEKHEKTAWILRSLLSK